MDAERLTRFSESGRRLGELIAGLDQKALLRSPPADARAGVWSIQQVVIHLMDSDLIWSARLKQIIAEDNPRIVPFDEGRFADRLFCDRQSAADAATIFELNRRNFGRVLLALPESAWARTGIHAERGTMRLDECFSIVEEHLEHHAGFIRKKRALLGL
ncbi:MAG: DinB family protein [Planctomycetaceae bacterium]